MVIMGVGAEEKHLHGEMGSAKNMVLTWVLTFPGCGLLAYVLTRIVLVVS